MRVERQLAGWRLPLASFSLLAVWFAPSVGLFALVAFAPIAVILMKIAAYEDRKQGEIDAAVLEERRHLARDLHDGTFSLLTGVALETERLLRMPKKKLAQAQDQIRQIQDSLSDGQRTLRLLIDGLRTGAPALLSDDVNLDARLKRLAERLERQWRVAIDWTTEAECHDAPPAVLDQVYLMIHEALVNVGRHANATTASVTVTVSGEEMRIVVADDGRGFDLATRREGETVPAGPAGPWTVRERAARLGGTVAVESGHDRTVVEIRIPITPVRA